MKITLICPEKTNSLSNPYKHLKMLVVYYSVKKISIKFQKVPNNIGHVLWSIQINVATIMKEKEKTKIQKARKSIKIMLVSTIENITKIAKYLKKMF